MVLISATEARSRSTSSWGVAGRLPWLFHRSRGRVEVSRLRRLRVPLEPVGFRPDFLLEQIPFLTQSIRGILRQHSNFGGGISRRWPMRAPSQLMVARM